ncbi:MAG TPA: sigma factor-like helix-turn-helix DNA-binding protein [Candidatus Saccharibacteria bacterium]|mgnify:FL=1|nr:sigma factor-like helix-turn-helix DNA-binding protein [Candidatus Saccharibacteria bacterium]
MEETTQTDMSTSLQTAVSDVLGVIEQDREREIISRRFGLSDRKETLEQIGELLGITRERVRQLEKAILIRLKLASEDNKVPSMHEVERQIIRHLSEKGRVARVQDVARDMVGKDATPIHRSHIGFLAELSPNLAVVNENDDFYHSIGIKEHADEKKIKAHVDEIVKTIKAHGEPISSEDLHAKLSHEHPSHVSALASTSKKLASLRDNWGLVKWPTVNPKNIRDKIYVILADNGKPMHFSEIAKSIKVSDFKRKDVTTQAIHNELIKDKRFVLIGRGIYALDEWGYSKGTVSDIITDVLKKAGEPLHRDEIVKRVLKSRQVKETTILLNLQSKPQFKRVSKATYKLAEPAK